MSCANARADQLIEDPPYSGVRAAFGHEGEDVALAGRQLLERVARPLRPHEFLDERRVDDRATMTRNPPIAPARAITSTARCSTPLTRR